MSLEVLYMWRIEQVVYSPTFTTREPGPPITEPTNRSGRSCRTIGCPVGRLQSSSFSLRPDGPGKFVAITDSRGKSSVHGETAQETDLASSTIGQSRGTIDQRLGNRRLGGKTPWHSASWVEPGLNVTCLCNCNCSLIVWPPKRWPKPTLCWCQAKSR